MRLVALIMAVGIFTSANLGSESVKQDEPDWMKVEKAFQHPNPEKKFYLVDVYTDWCGPCKRMDQTTFRDSSVVAYLDENFIPVKFNAESKTPVNFDGKTFNFRRTSNGGHHALANKLLNGEMGYPSFVVLNDKLEVVSLTRGFLKPEQLLGVLKAAKEK